jgi:hypothetical protein
LEGGKELEEEEDRAGNPTHSSQWWHITEWGGVFFYI